MIRIGYIVTAIAIVLTVSVLSLRAATDTATTKPTTEEQIGALRVRVAELEAQVAQLQTQIKQKDLAIERMQRRMAIVPKIEGPLSNAPPGITLGTAPALVAPAIPPGWVPQQFNGSTFYLVPLSQQQEAQTTKGAPSGTGTLTLPAK